MNVPDGDSASDRRATFGPHRPRRIIRVSKANVQNGDPPAIRLSPFGPYRPIRKIGEGAHGEVSIATGPEGYVALKVSRKPDDPERLADWEREKRGWALLSRIPPHPGIVRVFRSSETKDGEAFWVAMQLADSEMQATDPSLEDYSPLTLASVAESEVALPLARVLKIGEALASALEHLQKHHLLHRDVKPGNVLFVGGKPVIADAGLVVDVREAASLVGTPGYVPPENHGTPQGDVFSLGKTLWRIGTGRSPEEAGFAPCAEADTDDPDFWRFLAIVGKATNPSPGRRFRSAKAMRRAIAKLRFAHAVRASRRARLVAIAILLPFIIPAIWNFGYFRILMSQEDWVKAQVVWPFPYKILKPLLAPKVYKKPAWQDPGFIDEMQKSIEENAKELRQSADGR